MSRREALEAAFDKLEGEDTEEVAVTEEPVNENEQEGAQGAAGKGESPPAGEKSQKVEASADGKVEQKKPPADGLGKEAKKVDPKGEKTDPALERAAQAAQGDGTKAPVSWKPAAKGHWDKLPVDVRQDVLRREQEISRYITQNDHHRRFGETFNAVVRPFEHLIRAQNSTPLKAFHNLMTTAAGLATGNKTSKASIIAEIIHNYDVDIETLDKILAGGGVHQQQQNRGSGTIDPSILQALAPINSFMNEVNEARTQRQQRQAQEAEDLITQHENLPYFDELRDDMADLMDIAAKRGVAMTLPQAYEKALALNPEYAKIVAQKKAEEEARANGGTRIAKARRAASTLTGAPAGGGEGSGKPKTRREALENAWDEAAQQ